VFRIAIENPQTMPLDVKV